MKLYQYELQFDNHHKKLKNFRDPNDFIKYKSEKLEGSIGENAVARERLGMFITHDIDFAQDYVADCIHYFKNRAWCNFTNPYDGTIGYAVSRDGLRIFMTEHDADEAMMFMHELDSSEVEDFLIKFMEITEYVFNAGIHPKGVENDYIVTIDSNEVNVC